MVIIDFFEWHFASRYLKRKKDIFLKKYPQVVCISWDLISMDIMTKGRYALDECENLQNFVFSKLSNKRTCLDIGANIGNHSLFFSDFFDSVLSFEPNPITFKVLSINADLVKNIIPINIGASDIKRQVTVRHNAYNSGATMIENDGPVLSGNDDTLVQFNLDRFDDYLSSDILSNVDFIKLDVEGHELFALNGLRNALTINNPVVAFECSEEEFSNGTTPVMNLLKSYGYSFFYEFERKVRFNSITSRFKLAERFVRLVFGEQNYTFQRPSHFQAKDYGLIIGSKYSLD